MGRPIRDAIRAEQIRANNEYERYRSRLKEGLGSHSCTHVWWRGYRDAMDYAAKLLANDPPSLDRRCFTVKVEWDGDGTDVTQTKATG